MSPINPDFRDQVPLSHTNFDEFMRALNEMRKHVPQILADVPVKGREKDSFVEVARSFAQREASLLECRKNVHKTLERLEREVNDNESSFRNFETELKKMEITKYETFLHAINKELKREELYKEKAVEAYLGSCINNELNTEASSSYR